MQDKCSVCTADSKIEESRNSERGLFFEIDCPRCGTYFVSDLAKGNIDRALILDEFAIKKFSKEKSSAGFDSQNALCIEVAIKSIAKGIDEPRSIISHVLRKSRNTSTIKTDDIVNILKNNSLPTPAGQAKNLIMFLGTNLHSTGDIYTIPNGNIPKMQEIGGLLGFKIGKEWPDLRYIITSLEEQRIIHVDYLHGGKVLSGEKKIPEKLSLTLAGWQKYEELKRSVKETRKAFIAMAFVKPDKENYFFQNTLLEKHLKPAVKQTGYDLSNPLASEPTAGNIHARMEVEIRASRFIIAELSHHNNGAYWEAGFARGLGKPVIYMFNKKIAKEEKPPHFDVGSDHIIFWEEDKPDAAAQALKGVIRATLYGEAIMED